MLNYEVRLMSGNEAIARGLYESGVSLVTGYPGTPSSEVIKHLAEIDGELVCWSVNEKVAFEEAYAAALSGVRSACVMKHLGTHWILDPLAVSAITGVSGGLLIISADDPVPESSQSSTDTRNHAVICHIPVVEPSSPSEAKELVQHCFELSERFNIPVLMRYTARLAHMSEPVDLGRRTPGRIAEFRSDPDRLVSIAPNARRNIPELFRKVEEIREFVGKSPWVRIEEGSGSLGVVTSGVPYLHLKEVVERENVRPHVLKLSVAYPLPDISDFLSQMDRIIVLEDLDPIVEDQIYVLAYEKGISVKIIGKHSGHFRQYGEITYEDVRSALIGDPPRISRELVPRRIPQLCPGCPHRGAFVAIKSLKDAIVLGDRGCYNQGGNPPLRAIDTAIAMGSSVAMAVGLWRAGVNRPIVAVIGDSTFFHAGIPPLVEAVVSRAPIVIAVLDNRWTCMTGHQPNPSTGLDHVGRERPRVSIEDVCRAVGVGFVITVDPYNVDEGRIAMKVALEVARYKSLPSVVVFRRECVLQVIRREGRTGAKYSVGDECIGCLSCLSIGCPAMDLVEGKVVILDTCTGCGICSQVCPVGAIRREEP